VAGLFVALLVIAAAASTVTPTLVPTLGILVVGAALFLPPRPTAAIAGVAILLSIALALAEGAGEGAVRVVNVLLASGLAITASLVLERRIQRIDHLARREAALLASVPDALFVLDREGRIRQANSGLARLVPEARAGERLHPLLGHVLADGTTCTGGCALDGGADGSSQVVPVEGERIIQAGRVIPVAYTRQDLAEDSCVAISLRDVSARVAHQADRRALLEAAARADEQARLIRALGSRSALSTDPSTGVLADVGHLGTSGRPGESVDVSVLPDGRVLALMVDAPQGAALAERDAWKVMYAGRAHMAAGAPLGEMVARCAELLSGESGIPTASMLGVVLDPQTGLVQVASGGHLPPLLVHPDGRTHWIEAAGVPMGVQDAGSRSVAAAELGPADVLLLYTEAVVAGSGDPVEGLATLRSAAVALRHQDPAGWSQRLLATVRPAGGRDATVVALRLSEQAASGAA
jgi:PAS domain-containing protein